MKDTKRLKELLKPIVESVLQEADFGKVRSTADKIIQLCDAMIAKSNITEPSDKIAIYHIIGKHFKDLSITTKA